MNTSTAPKHPTSTANPAVLAKFRTALDALYGDRIERVVLYGSRARGDARPDSDYDVAVFLKDLTDRWAEAEKIAFATSEILMETGEVIHATCPTAKDPIENAHR